ncbi:MAG TPA: hypothetical protein V6D12_15500 [Candidatus Obscuribacterales bacterium]
MSPFLLDSLLSLHCLGLGVLRDFIPALRIDGIATAGDMLSPGIYRGGIRTLMVA